MKWDLFNPKPNFNYETMNSKLDISTLDNPNVQVVWEDMPENFTQERIRSVKQYFMKKYATNNVNVITKVKSTDDVEQTIDVSINIMDKNYQNELVKSILEQKYPNISIDKIVEIDSAVESRLLINDVEISPFKKWYIKKIEFSNFLSYGENQVIDFDKCNGITVVESNPPNFGGKTVLTVDLLLFLFFNTTTKTTKAEEIFNKYTDKNKVSVKGDVIIDGEEYIIVRTIERKKSKSGEWNVKTDLDFFKKLADGQLQNFTGEQRRETENFIKRSIGDMDDFLMTIVTTASNLEDLIESKPTARGQVLSRFLGLEFLKKKEETGKEIYSEFSKGMMSNVYDTETLKQNNQTSKEEIESLEKKISDAELQIKDVDGRLQKGQEYKDDLLKSKHTDLEEDLILLNPVQLKSSISDSVSKVGQIEEQIKNVQVVEPKEFYHEDKHDKVKDEIKVLSGEILLSENRIKEIEELVSKFGNGIQCEHCGIQLMEAALTKKKISEKESIQKKLTDSVKKLKKLEQQEKSFVDLKSQFDIYEKNKLIREKLEVSLESEELKMTTLEDKLSRYNKVQEKIKKNNEIDSKLLKANLRIDELITEKRGYEKIKVESQLNIENHKTRIDKNNEIILKIAEEFQREKLYKVYLEIFGKNGISKMIMKTMMPLINSELQRLLQDSSFFNLEIVINDKNEVEFVMIDRGTGIQKSISTGSGYERTIAAMALRAVLSKVCSLPKPNLIVLDEVFAKVANDNLDMIGEFFQKINQYFEKIFVISHNPMVNNWANSRVLITKTDNVSKVSQ